MRSIADNAVEIEFSGHHYALEVGQLRLSVGLGVPYMTTKPRPRRRRPEARVVKDYQAQNDGDVSLSVGQLVAVKNADDAKSWWAGTLRDSGKRGVFPRECVKLLPPRKADHGERPVRNSAPDRVLPAASAPKALQPAADVRADVVLP